MYMHVVCVNMHLSLQAEIVKRSQVEEEEPSSIPSPTSKEEYVRIYTIVVFYVIKVHIYHVQV
jgi:hypothetical protein